MFKKYFNQELSNLKEIAAEFSRGNPAIAPMLGEPSSDPDVDRLLEGVAFLNGVIREKIDDEFPEILHDLLRQVWPHYLRPLPSATIVGFSPIENKGQTVSIPSGVEMESVPVDGTPCTFRTCYQVDVPPVSISDVIYEEPSGKDPVIRLCFNISGLSADSWKPEKLRMYLGGTYKEASDLYLVLIHNIKQIVINTPENGKQYFLDRSHLRPAGFSENDELIPYPSNSFQGYRFIQEYFLMPEKFLFFDLTGWDLWSERGNITEFQIDFQLTSPPPERFKPRSHSFVLSATPAINIFSHGAYPVVADHRKTEYRVRPASEDLTKYQIYSIEKVSGYMHGLGKEMEFKPFHSFSAGESVYVYNEILRKSPIRDGIDVNISIAYPEGGSIAELKTLSFDTLCTNGYLPEWLSQGDVCVATSSIPEFVSFKNLNKPTVAVLPPIGSNTLWRLTSLLTLNYVSLSKPENLKSLLKLYLMEGSRDKKKYLANSKRVDGIKDLETVNVDRLVSGTMMRGIEVRLSVSQDHFSGSGDMYLFGTVLDNFLGLYASINTFTRLVINEMATGEKYTWPERIGNQTLI